MTRDGHDDMNRQRDFQMFNETFAGVVVGPSTTHQVQIAGGYELRPLSRRERLWRWLTTYRGAWPTWLREPKMKPRVQIECPPLEEHWINWTGPAQDYEPGSFAREVAEFYAEGEE